MSEPIPLRPRSRLHILPAPGGLRLEATGQRSLGSALVLAAWLVAWAGGEAIAARQLFFTEAPEQGAWFLGLWLALWTAGGVVAAGALLRSLRGREVLALEGRALTLRAEPMGRSRRLDAALVRDLRVEPAAEEGEPAPGSLSEEWDPRRGRPVRPAALAFECGGRTWRFGVGLAEAELEKARAALAGRLPS